MRAAAVGDTERGTLHVVIARDNSDAMQLSDQGQAQIDVRPSAAAGRCQHRILLTGISRPNATTARDALMSLAAAQCCSFITCKWYLQTGCIAWQSVMFTARCTWQEAGSAFDAAMHDGQDGDAAARVIAQITEATPALLAAGTPCSPSQCNVL